MTMSKETQPDHFSSLGARLIALSAFALIGTAAPAGAADADPRVVPKAIPQIDFGKAFSARPERPVVQPERPAAKPEHAPLVLSSSPNVLPSDAGRVRVRFGARWIGKGPVPERIFMRRVGDEQRIALNDAGKDGDYLAGDGIAGTALDLDAGKIPADSCVSFEAIIETRGGTQRSAPMKLCATRFPVGAAASNTSDPLDLGGGAKAVADEVLIQAKADTPADSIRRVAESIGARVAGTVLPLDLYQLRLARRLKADEMKALIAQLGKLSPVRSASINAIGRGALDVNDSAFDLPPADVNSQHGLKLVLGHVEATNANAWDGGATGAGITVVVIDTGIDRSHPDFGTPGNCQLATATGNCGDTNTDAAVGVTPAGHGTQVAGVVAARTNNGAGVAGAAFGAKVHSIRIPNFTTAGMASAFDSAATHIGIDGTAKVVNASFNAINAFADWNPVCTAINNVVQSGGIPRAVVVAAAGNENLNGASYPARCNDSNPNPADKSLLITVSNSVSLAGVAACGSVAVDERCSTSNYGAWVDLAAPGSAIRTTTIGGAYASVTGTSFSSPLVSGAAAILASCGVPLNEIQSTLQTSALVFVPYPGSGPNPTPRLDIARALQQRNRVPTAIALSNNTIDENTNTSAGYEVGTLSATDPDTCDTHTYTIVGGADAALFSIGGPSGDRLRLTAGTLDYEAKSSYAVTVRVTDLHGQSFNQSFTINVANLNEPLVGTPTIIGSPTEDVTLSASTAGMADGDGPISCTFEWLRNGSAVASGNAYTLDDADVGSNMSVRATCTTAGGFPPGIATSTPPIGPVINVNDMPVGTPTITGARTVGQTLSANASGVTDADGLGAFTYQWIKMESGSPVVIAGANAATYTLATADFGAFMGVRVTYTDGHGTAETIESGWDSVAVGDPHLTTVDGLRYDFQGAGEFVLLRGTKGLEIQARMTPVSTASTFTDPYSGLAVGVSINTAVAARIGEHRVTYQQAGAGQPSGKMELRVDGQVVSLPPEGMRFATGGRLLILPDDVLQADFPDGTTMTVTPGWWAPHSVWYLNVSVFHTPAYQGLMGARGKGSWLPALADGSSLGAMPSALADRYEHLYVRLADSWRVGEASGLFDYAPNTSPRSFAIKSWPPKAPPFVIPAAELPPGASKEIARALDAAAAKQQCRILEGQAEHADCLFDVQVTGHPGFARTHLQHRRLIAGLVAVNVRELRSSDKTGRATAFVATVTRHGAAAGPIAERKQEAASRLVTTGSIQFTLGGKDVGPPVPIDAKGHARLDLPRDKAAVRRVGARYLPAKESGLLPAATNELSPLYIRKR